MIRSYLKSKAKQKLGKYRDALHSGLLNACEELKAHRKANPADKHLAHIRSELKELGVSIEHKKDGYYYVYPASITNKTLISKLTIKQRDIHKAWETGKDMVAELARRYLENLEDRYTGSGK